MWVSVRNKVLSRTCLDEDWRKRDPQNCLLLLLLFLLCNGHACKSFSIYSFSTMLYRAPNALPLEWMKDLCGFNAVLCQSSVICSIVYTHIHGLYCSMVSDWDLVERNWSSYTPYDEVHGMVYEISAYRRKYCVYWYWIPWARAWMGHEWMTVLLANV